MAASLEAAKHTRSHGEEMRWASLGVRRGAMLSRWEFQLIRLRAEAVLVASDGCVMKRPFESFVVRNILSRGRRRVWVSCGWAERW